MRNLLMSLLSLVFYSVFGFGLAASAAAPEIPNVQTNNPARPMLTPRQISQVNQLLKTRYGNGNRLPLNGSAGSSSGGVIQIETGEIGVVPMLKYGVFLPPEEVYIKPIPEPGMVAKYGVNIPPQIIIQEPIIKQVEPAIMKYGVPLPEPVIHRPSVALPEVEHNVMQRPEKVNINAPVKGFGHRGHKQLPQGVVKKPEVLVNFGIPEESK